MKIIDILIESAELLGLHNDIPQLNSFTTENEEEILSANENIANLFKLIKYSIRELCTNYIPIIDKKTIVTENKTYPLAEFPNFIRIKNITKQEELVKFKLIGKSIILEEDGEYVVNYATYPVVLSVFDELDFLQEFSPDAIVLGLCSYFSLAQGRFDEFQTFNEKYVARAESLKSLKTFNLPVRRWQWERKKLLN